MRSRSVSLLMVLTAVILLTAALCACTPKPINVPNAQAAVTLHALDVLKQAGQVAISIREFERAQVAKGLISPTQDQTFNFNFAKLQGVADKVIDQVVAKSISVATAAQAIIDQLQGLVLDGQQALAALVTGLKSLLVALRGGTLVPVQ